MSITSTYPRLRLVEAIVDVLSADAGLISLTEDGELDNYGTLHHIGEVLNETALTGRTPYVGVQIIEDAPLIPGVARAHIFRSTVLVWVYSKNELIVTELGDRVQYLLTTPGDDDCNGYLDFTNDHIRNMDTEFESRGAKAHEKSLDLYAETIQFNVIWSDVPCDLDVEIPQTEVCDLPEAADPGTVECITGLADTEYPLAEAASLPATLGTLVAEGGTGPYTYTIVAGDDRDEFTITVDVLDFVAAGPLTADDTYVVIIRATDSNGQYKDFVVTLTIVE